MQRGREAKRGGKREEKGGKDVVGNQSQLDGV
jgi:hypothetical protein